MIFRVGVLVVMCLGLALGSVPRAWAQQEGIAIELNKVESAPSGCRLHFDVHNTTGMKFEVFSVDLVFFDTDGVVSSRSLVSFGRLHPNKHHFNSWEFPSVECTKVGRILVNGIQQCQHDGGESFDCLSALSASHKGKIELVK
tara:strand:+ start:4132 stop:4560 length:429 start_codon:yes stop_codon:yes gene_type:complete